MVSTKQLVRANKKAHKTKAGRARDAGMTNKKKVGKKRYVTMPRKARKKVDVKGFDVKGGTLARKLGKKGGKHKATPRKKNGKTVYEGRRGGLYVLTSGGKRRYVKM